MMGFLAELCSLPEAECHFNRMWTKHGFALPCTCSLGIPSPEDDAGMGAVSQQERRWLVMPCGAGTVEQRAAVQYREKMWGTLGQERCLLQEIIHHTGVCKCQPLPLPLLCRAEGSQLLPHQEQQGQEGTKPSIPREPSAQQVLRHDCSRWNTSLQLLQILGHRVVTSSP